MEVGHGRWWWYWWWWNKILVTKMIARLMMMMRRRTVYDYPTSKEPIHYIGVKGNDCWWIIFLGVLPYLARVSVEKTNARYSA
jgi:hypothetical protein